MKNQIWDYSSNRTKEIIREDQQKMFTGKAHVVLNIIDPSITSILRDPKYSEEVKHISNEEFLEFSSEVEKLIGDPSYQFSIIEMMSDNMDNAWKYKKLGGNWIETKAEAIKNLDNLVGEALKNLAIEVSVYYMIDAFGSSIRTSSMIIGKISGEQIKTCSTYSSLLEAARPYITKRIEDDMKPLIENDEAKIENDIMMLNILLKKYPNYKDLILNEKS